MEQISLFPLEEKIRCAVETIKLFEKTALQMDTEGYYLAFSGGKDSQVIYALAKMAGVKFTAHYHVTTVDPPELVRFIRAEYPEVRMERPELSMWQLIVKKGFPPTRRVRYCCSELKERGGSGCFTITGVRRAESSMRRRRGLAELSGQQNVNIVLLNNDNDEKRRLIENCQLHGKRVLNPIIDWTDAEVWSFIRQYIHKYCRLYDEGFSRLGCIGCPMTSVRKRRWELTRYPGFKKAYLKTFERMLRERKLEYSDKTRWKDAEEVYQWWLYGNEKKEKQVRGQLSLVLEAERRNKVDEDKKIKGKNKKEWQEMYQQFLSKWQKIHDYGDMDQIWTDGVSLNRIRQELLHVKEILLSYGEEVSVPSLIPETYMANKEAIQKQAADSLKKYLASENYQYLCRMEPQLTNRQQKKTQVYLVLGSIRNLMQAMEDENYVVMREFGVEGKFDRQLAEAASQVRKLPPIKAGTKTKRTGKTPSAEIEDLQIEGQMSIYDMAS